MNFKLILNKIESNKVFKNGLLFSFFSILNNGISFFLLLILAKFLSPEDYGKLNLFTTFITLFSILISLNTNSYVSIAFFKKKEKLTKIINIVICVTLVICLLLCVVLGLFKMYLTPLIGFPYKYQLVAVIICLFQVLNNLNLETWRLEEKPIQYGTYSLLFVILNLAGTLYFVICLNLDWRGRVYVQLLFTFIFFIIAFIFLIRKKYLKIDIPDKSTVKDTFSYSIPLIPHLISIWLRQGMDRYIINFFWGSIMVGLYSFAYNFAIIIQIIGAAFNSANSVNIFKNLSENPEAAKKYIVKEIKYMFLFYLVLFFVVLGLSYTLIPVVMPKYKNSIKFLFPLCLASFFHCIYLLFVNFLFFYEKTKKLMHITISISLINLCLSFVLTRYNTLWNSYLFLLSNMTICFFVIKYSLKYAKFELKDFFS